MRLVTYDRGGARRLGAWVGETMVDLPDVVGHPAFPTTMERLVSHSKGTILDAARDMLTAEDVGEFVVPRPQLLVPFLPAPFRVALPEPANGFGRASDVDGSPAGPALIGPDQPVPWPPEAERLTCDVEVACIIGRAGQNLSPEEAADVIFGYTLAAAWSVPDPSNNAGRYVALTLGPSVVTADDLDSAGDVTTRVNGEVWFSGDVAAARRSLCESVAETSQQRAVVSGDVFGSGPFPGGVTALIPRTFSPGDVVEVEADEIGVLRVELGRPA